MQVCSQCQFIYEDDQERCDMDGAELIYEATLEHAFPAAASPPERTKLIIPIDTVRREIAKRPAVVLSRPRQIAWQIAAAVLVAGVAFLAFYAAPPLFGARPWIPPQKIATHDLVSVSAAVAAMAGNTPIVESDPAPSPPAIEPRTIPVARATIAVLPSLKPLPRLKPLPTLKPIPRLADQSRAMNANHKGVFITAKPNADKKESRFGAFLKKTGRALKKPFK